MIPINTTRAARPVRTVHEGRRVTLVPLDPAAHASALYPDTHGAEKEQLWRYLFEGPFAHPDLFRASLDKKAASDDPLFFTILDRATGRAAGGRRSATGPRHQEREVRR